MARLVNWNIERRAAHSWQVKSLIAEIAVYQPELVCLTEAHEDTLAAFGGHVMSDIGYRAAHKKPSERLVVLWSKARWEPLPIPQDLRAAGGIVAGRTDLAGHEVLCVGLCIPYHMAKRAGETRTRPWHHHKIFLKHLKPWLETLPDQGPVVVMGDFNQRIPRKYGSREAHAALLDSFTPFQFITAGALAPLDENTIDHIVLSGPLIANKVEARSRFAPDGRARSDHFGVFAEIERL